MVAFALDPCLEEKRFADTSRLGLSHNLAPAGCRLRGKGRSCDVAERAFGIGIESLQALHGWRSIHAGPGSVSQRLR